MATLIDIAGLDKAQVLIALYQGARPQGLGWWQELAPGTAYGTQRGGDLSVSDAQKALTETTFFEYVKGRVLKVDLSGTAFDAALYDRDNGPGKAARVIASLRQAEGAPHV